MAFLYPVTQPFKQYTDAAGAPLENGYVYFGTANLNPETNPIQMYWDAAGTIPAAQPLRTSAGYIVRAGTPSNVYAVGDFSITVRDKNGALIFTHPTSTDIQLALAVAGGTLASAIPLVDAGGYYTTDNVEAAFQQVGGAGFVDYTRLAAAVQALLVPTGAKIGFVGLTAPTGWVLGSGRTIGSAASGATERANADTVNLYTLLWNSYDNTVLVIEDSAGTPTTRGVSASNDYAANKRLPVPDYRGRVDIGKDDMGGSAAGRITVAGGAFDGTVMGVSGGAQNVTISTSQLPAHNHGVTDAGHNHTQNAHNHGVTDPTHRHTYNDNAYAQTSDGGGGNRAYAASGTYTSYSSTGITINNTTPTNNSATTGITTTNTGSGSTTPIVQPAIVSTVIIKL